MSAIIGKKGKSLIKWEPRVRCVIITDDERNDEDKKRMAAVGLIDIGTLSDKDRLTFGGVSKSAELANKMSEEQKPYRLIAVGDECTYEVGDVVLFQGGCQGTSIKIEDKFYLQLGEYEILGKFIE